MVLRFTDEEWTKYQAEHFSDGLAKGFEAKNGVAMLSQAQSLAKGMANKYHATPTVYETIYGPVRFASKKEATEAQKIDLATRAGQHRGFLINVPFRLPGGAVHRLDFAILENDGTITWREAKGKDLSMGKWKRRQVEQIYKIRIEVV